jgi:patatin-like phospholipase/acyl hydrolase
MYYILSLDGGGMRGLITLTVLERLVAAHPQFLKKINLISGTSTGGLIALGLASGLSPYALRNLYYEQGEKIFQDSWWDDLLDGGNLWGAEYDSQPLAHTTKLILGRKRLRDLRKKVLITTFDLEGRTQSRRKQGWKPKFFHNFDGSDSDGAVFAADVATYTTAAPIYFPSVDGFIDGGVCANNPSMAALAQTQDPRAAIHPRPNLSDICMISLGTGKVTRTLPEGNGDRGIVQWARPLIDLMLDATTDLADYQCRQLLRGHYQRITPFFSPDQNYHLDDWQARDELIGIGQQIDLRDTLSWLEKYW